MAQGENLGRNGKLHFVQLGTEDGSVFLFDIFTLGICAFEHGGLRALLEDARVTKLMYDCRHDADALFHLCGGVRVAGAVDLQIAFMSALTCKTPYLPPYDKALKEVLPRGAFERLEIVKRAGRAAFAPDHGGSYTVWAVRPLPPLLFVYASMDLCHMFKVRDKHIRTRADSSDATAADGVHTYTLAEVSRETEERLRKTYERADMPWPYGCVRLPMLYSCIHVINRLYDCSPPCLPPLPLGSVVYIWLTPIPLYTLPVVSGASGARATSPTSPRARTSPASNIFSNPPAKAPGSPAPDPLPGPASRRRARHAARAPSLATAPWTSAIRRRDAPRAAETGRRPPVDSGTPLAAQARAYRRPADMGPRPPMGADCGTPLAAQPRA